MARCAWNVLFWRVTALRALLEQTFAGGATMHAVIRTALGHDDVLALDGVGLQKQA